VFRVSPWSTGGLSSARLGWWLSLQPLLCTRAGHPFSVRPKDWPLAELPIGKQGSTISGAMPAGF
jgi:hypothetical protein